MSLTIRLEISLTAHALYLISSLSVNHEELNDVSFYQVPVSCKSKSDIIIMIHIVCQLSNLNTASQQTSI